MAKFKKGDVVVIKQQYREKGEEGEYEVVEPRGFRYLIRSLDPKVQKMRIIPTEVVAQNMIQKVR